MADEAAQTRQLLDEVDRHFWRGQADQGFVFLMRAACAAARARYPESVATNEHDALESWFDDEWPAIVAATTEPIQRVFRGKVASIAHILYSAYDERKNDPSSWSESLEIEVSDDAGDFWFEPSPHTIHIHRNWFTGISRAIKHAPECARYFPDSENMPESVRLWLLLRGRTRSTEEYAKARANRIARLDTDTQTVPAELPPPFTRQPFHPTQLDELRFQLINLRILCQLYWQRHHTLYKAATVVLRTVLLGSSGDVPLATVLPSPRLPRLLVQVPRESSDHLTMPSRVSLGGRIFFNPGSRANTIIMAGGAVPNTRVGSLFTPDLIPLNDWLSQPFLYGDLTIRQFLQWVAHKDGGAHYEFDHAGIRRLERCASIHWSLSIRIGEVVADELLRQFSMQYPNLPFRVP